MTDRNFPGGLATELARVRALNGELIEALRMLYEDTADYIRINHLGDVHHNRAMQLARDAIAKAEAQSMARFERTEHFAVTVERKGEAVVTIETNHLSGRELNHEDEDAIRSAARSLLSFIGEPTPARKD